MQIDQSPYCTCKQDTQERYLWTAEPKGLGGLLPPPPPLHLSEENFFFTNGKYLMNFLTEKCTTTAQLTLTLILLLLTLIREKQ